MKERLTIAIIVFQVFAWSALVLFPYFNKPPGIDHYLFNFHVKHLSVYLWLVLVFNLNYFVFIPRFFQRQKFYAYAAFLITLFAGLVVSDTFISEKMFPNVYHLGFRVRLLTTIPFITTFATSTAVRALTDWLAIRENTRTLEAEKQRAEMAFLRSQLNPHFLFNTLNNIIELMHKDVNKAEDFVVKLSVILRTALQGQGVSKITLDEELNLIKNYVELQSLRLSSNNKVKFEVSGNTAGLNIEPLLLINFIENVFKHGLSDTENELIIRIHAGGGRLELYTENNISRAGRPGLGKGIGLDNVKKRLEIAYRNKYRLQLQEHHSRFKLNLGIDLE